MIENQRVEVEKDRRLWCRVIVTAQIYLTIIALSTVHYLFNPFHLSSTPVIIITGVICGLSSIILLILCIYFCHPSKEILGPAPTTIRRMTAASIETDPAFYIGGTMD